MKWIEFKAFCKRNDLDIEGEVAEFLMNIDEDNEYMRAVLSGHWPQSVEILSDALKQAKRIRKIRSLKTIKVEE